MAKTCSHPDCPFKVFSRGLCTSHWKRVYGKPIVSKASFKPLTQTTDGLEAVPFQVYRTADHKRTKSPSAEQANQKKELDMFFKEQGELVPLRCENCNLLLNAFNAWAQKCVTAHILPKNDNAFPSVATNSNNVMFLGKGIFSECNCHTNYDDQDSNYRFTMNCYPLIIERFNKFKHLLTDGELIKANKYLHINNDECVEI